MLYVRLERCMCVCFHFNVLHMSLNCTITCVRDCACVRLYSTLYPLIPWQLTNVNSKTLRLKLLFQRGNRPAFSIRRSSHLSERESYRRRDGGLNLVTDPKSDYTLADLIKYSFYTFSPPKNRLRFHSQSTNQEGPPCPCCTLSSRFNTPAILFSGSGCYTGERADVAKRRGSRVEKCYI